MNEKLHSILSAAYQPCPEFNNKCREMRWDPPSGHVPRGFCGALGGLEEVQLVLVVAEPGNPHNGEAHKDIESALSYAYKCFKYGKDQFHRNINGIVNLCWPNEPFEKQMRRVWLTESVLCSAKNEGGHVKAAVARACINRYLLNQLALFPDTLVIALGLKAQNRLRGLVDFFPAFSAAPPGCNKLQAKDSWRQIPGLLKKHSQNPAGTARPIS